MKDPLSSIKKQIIDALTHPEAEDGLYLNNLLIVHEEEERPIVVGEEGDVVRALNELATAGEIVVSGEGESAIYGLPARA